MRDESELYENGNDLENRTNPARTAYSLNGSTKRPVPQINALNNELSPQTFYNSLNSEEKIVITLRNDLYNGSWTEMEQDVQQRVEMPQRISMLEKKLKEDLETINKIRTYELTHGVNLADYMQNISKEITKEN